MKLLLKIAQLSCLAALTASTIVAMPNPASVHCLKKGGKLKILKTSRQDEYGVCQWEATPFYAFSECGEWAFMRGECKRGQCASWKAGYDGAGAFKSFCGEKLP